jgi:hypothetical protein
MVDDQKTKPEYASEKAYIDAVISESSGVHTAALVGMIVCILLLALYLALQVKAARDGAASNKTEETQSVSYLDYLPNAAPVKTMPDGWLMEKGIRMHIEYLRNKAKEQYDAGPSGTPYAAFLADQGPKLSAEIVDELCSLYKVYVGKSPEKQIGQDAMFDSLTKIGLNYKKDDFTKMFAKADANKSKTLDQDEFVEFFKNSIIFSTDSLPWEGGDDDEEDDDEMPDEFKDLDPNQQKKAILTESFQKMIIGTILVLIFSDPMVDVLGAIGKMSGVPPFYVAFSLGTIGLQRQRARCLV